MFLWNDIITIQTQQEKSMNNYIFGKELIEDWLKFCNYKEKLFSFDPDLTKFKKLVKNTCLYFQQLNTMDKIDMQNAIIFCCVPQ